MYMHAICSFKHFKIIWNSCFFFFAWTLIVIIRMKIQLKAKYILRFKRIFRTFILRVYFSFLSKVYLQIRRLVHTNLCSLNFMWKQNIAKSTIIKTMNFQFYWGYSVFFVWLKSNEIIRFLKLAKRQITDSIPHRSISILFMKIKSLGGNLLYKKFNSFKIFNRNTQFWFHISISETTLAQENKYR